VPFRFYHGKKDLLNVSIFIIFSALSAVADANVNGGTDGVPVRLQLGHSCGCVRSGESVRGRGRCVRKGRRRLSPGGLGRYFPFTSSEISDLYSPLSSLIILRLRTLFCRMSPLSWLIPPPPPRCTGRCGDCGRACSALVLTQYRRRSLSPQEVENRNMYHNKSIEYMNRIEVIISTMA